MHDDGTSPDAGAGPSHAAARILERIADAYIVLDAGFRFVEVNPAAERSMRRSKAELLGRSHREVFPASHDILAGVDYQRAARERVELHFTQHYRDEGRDIHLEIDVYPDDDRVTVLWRDVTAHVQTEQALHASEVRLRAVLDAVPVGVFVADANGRLAIINAQAAEIVGGAPPAERIADYAQYRGYWTDSGVELRAEDWALARALRTGERIAGERIELMRLDGGRRSVLNHAAPIHDATGQLLGGVAATVDVTAQVAAEAARQTELAERAAWFRSVFEQAPMAVVVGRGRSIEALVFELVNPRWAEMLPPKREFVGRPVDEAFPELAPEVRAVLAQVLATASRWCSTACASRWTATATGCPRTTTSTSPSTRCARRTARWRGWWPWAPRSPRRCARGARPRR
jgi:PAS domain S-box-containing protein